MVVLHCPRAFILCLLGENKALDQRFEGCSERCLNIDTGNHYSFWDPPYFYRFRWSRPDSATRGFFDDSGGLTTTFHAYGRGGRIRTGDHLNPIQVRYQAALHPDLITLLYNILAYYICKGNNIFYSSL